MNYKKNLSLALCLLAAGTANASNDTNKPAVPAVEVKVPNIPPELAAPPVVAPVSAPSASNALATTAAPAAGAKQEAQPQVPALNGDACTGTDCQPAPVSKPAPKVRKRKPELVISPNVNIGEPAQRAVTESHSWAENRLAMPVRDAGGRVVFPFGESAPTIVCAPLRVCDIELQAGESVQGAPHIGDAVRWKVAPAVSGSDDQKVTHLIIKPTEPGLDTNLIIPTDRRTYHIRLVSSAERYVSRVAFDYPEDHQQAWQDLSKASTTGTASSKGDMPTVAVNRLNFNYRIKVVKGNPYFKPLRAMDDGYHTYIAMNEDMRQQEAPALIGISPSGEEQMVNYRLKGNMYVVDGTIYRLALISGVGGDQQRIEVSRDECQKRGWLGICWDAKE
ncbi:P-type conjugative transfer protein TrbG [Chitinivorax sp. B]|uniref:P-type conjugative transfer protein TrbG n=1 Tax=Chitinivorax sp. B TaxID=2502235 RepID=UPI001484D6B9|nr:P-type conjugative transfer protein TrbG [Chitinivorax sp. B]